MPFAASYTGLGRDYPGFAATIGLAPEPELADHAAHVGHLVEHWVGENPNEHLSISVSGSIEGAQRLFTLNIAAVARPTVPTPASEEETPVDVSISGDPFAPEPADAAAPDAESEAPADPQPAVSEPVDDGAASDESAPSDDSEAQDAPGSAEDSEPQVVRVPEDQLDEIQHVSLAEPEADPTSLPESAGPTDADTEADIEADKSEAEIAEAPAPADDSAPAATDIEADTPESEITDERGIDATDEPDPTTDEEAH